MAITKIKPIKNRMDNVITYAINPNKTSKELYQELHNVIDYAKSSYKTEEQLYVTAINCDNDTAYEDMMMTKRRYDKTKGILGYHAFQSFKENEVTPDIAHKIGVELANELWGDRFEVIVTTHLNTNHIHNHFVLNSVSFVDGKKYYDNHSTYALMRETSDRICEEYKLSVIEEKQCKKSKIDYRNFYKGQVKKSTYHNIAKEDIDYAIGQAFSYRDFISMLKKMGYETNNRYGHLTVRKNPYKRNIRVDRAYGDEYSIENIEKKIYEIEKVREPFPEVRATKYKIKKKINLKNREKAKGIKALYFYYCFLFKIYPKKRDAKLSQEMRQEIKKMDNFSKETRLICKNNIETMQDLLSYKKLFIINRNELKSKKENLWKKHKRVATDEEKQEIYKEIQEIQKEIKKQNEEIRLIEDIEIRVPNMKAKIEEIEKEKQKGKEIEKNEYFK